MKKYLSLSLILLLSLTSCVKNNDNNIDVTLHLNGGTINGKEELKLTLEEFKNLNELPKLDNHLFSTYYLDKYFMKHFEPNMEISQDINLYAKYALNIYEYEIEENTYTITKINEGDYEEIIVPEYLNNNKVTKVCSNSFNNVKVKILDLPSIEEIQINAFSGSEINILKIGSNIKNIEYGAFRNIKRLTNVRIDSNPYYSSASNTILEKNNKNERTIIGFYGDVSSGFNESYLSTINILNIAPYSFSNIYINGKIENDVPSLKGFSLYIPSSIEVLSDYSFDNCKVYLYDKDQEKEIQLGVFVFDNLKEIGKYAFRNSSLSLIKYQVKYEGLTPVPNNDGVEIFKEGAFQSLNIPELVIPKSLKTIEKDCFKNTIVEKIFYEGSKEEFENIVIETGNDVLSSTQIYYYSKEYKDNCWYYYEDEETLFQPRLYNN